MNPVSAEVWENKEIATGIFRLKLRPYGPAPRVRPGQFFMIGLARGWDPLLRRPLSLLEPDSLPRSGPGPGFGWPPDDLKKKSSISA